MVIGIYNQGELAPDWWGVT